jgi:hypothetical protein
VSPWRFFVPLTAFFGRTDLHNLCVRLTDTLGRSVAVDVHRCSDACVKHQLLLDAVDVPALGQGFSGKREERACLEDYFSSTSAGALEGTLWWTVE